VLKGLHHVVGGRGRSGLAVGFEGDLQAEAAEAEGDEVGDDGVVVDDQDVGYGVPIMSAHSGYRQRHPELKQPL
jgi:hypothetical protein